MSRGRPIVVAVSGGGREAGKTALICGLLPHFPGAAAVKFGSTGAGRQPAVALAGDGPGEEAKDTGRMKRAGAAKVVFVRGRSNEEKNLARALALLEGHAPVFVEGAAAVRFGRPDLKIFVEKHGEGDKAGSSDSRSAAHFVVSLKNLRIETLSLAIGKLSRAAEGPVLRAVLARTRVGIITCAAARGVAGKLRVSPVTVGRLCNRTGIRINDCVLGCFGRYKEEQRRSVAELPGRLVANQKVWIERRGKHIMGEGGAALLRAVQKEGSINRAAQACGLSYRRAWAMIRVLEKSAGTKIVESSIGGRTGGGSSITPFGKSLLRTYEKLSERARNVLKEEMR